MFYFSVGYPRNYSEQSLEEAIGLFYSAHPDISIHIVTRNNEELYDMLVDLISAAPFPMNILTAPCI